MQGTQQDTKSSSSETPVGDSWRHAAFMSPLSAHPSKVLSPSTVTVILVTYPVIRATPYTHTGWHEHLGVLDLNPCPSSVLVSCVTLDKVPNLSNGQCPLSKQGE